MKRFLYFSLIMLLFSCTTDDEVETIEPKLTSFSILVKDNPLQMVDNADCEIVGDSIVECWVRNMMSNKQLIANFCFEKWGFELVQGFDVEPELIQNGVGNVPVSEMEKLPAYLKKHRVDIAVLAVPKEAAKETAGLLIENGISAIWNFTNVEITSPDSDVVVENFCFSDSLLALSYYITNPSVNGKTEENA